MQINAEFRVRTIIALFALFLFADLYFLLNSSLTNFKQSSPTDLMVELISPDAGTLSLKNMETVKVRIPELHGKLSTISSESKITYRFPLEKWPEDDIVLEASNPSIHVESAKLVNQDSLYANLDTTPIDQFTTKISNTVSKPSNALSLNNSSNLGLILLTLHFVIVSLLSFSDATRKFIKSKSSNFLVIASILFPLILALFFKESISRQTIQISWEQKTIPIASSVTIISSSTLEPNIKKTQSTTQLVAASADWTPQKFIFEAQKIERLAISWNLSADQFSARNIEVNQNAFPMNCLEPAEGLTHMNLSEGTLFFTKAEKKNAEINLNCRNLILASKSRLHQETWNFFGYLQLSVLLLLLISSLLGLSVWLHSLKRKAKKSLVSLNGDMAMVTHFTLFSAFCFIYFLIHRHATFIDELDNMVGAAAILRGGDIYKSFFSQHTPFTYYFVSVMYAFGIDKFEGFRLGFGLAVTSFLVFSSIRYRNVVSRFTFAFLGVIYAYFAPLFWGHMILSNTLAAFAGLAVFLEISKIYLEKKIEISHAIIITTAAFVGPMSAILSSFHILPMLFLLAGLIFTGKATVFPSLKSQRSFISRISYLILIGASPYFILLFWYLLTDNLGNFVHQSITFNREIYSRYNGGIGQQHAFAPFFEFPIGVFKNHFFNLIHTFWIKDINWNLDSKIAVCLVLSNCVLAIYWLIKRQWFLLLAWLVCLGYSQYRGASGMHAMPYILPSLFAASQLLSIGLNLSQVLLRPISVLRIINTLPFIFLLYIGYESFISAAGTDLDKDYGTLLKSSFSSHVTEKLTSPNDSVFDVGLDLSAYVALNRKCAGRFCGMAPWVYDGFKKEILEDLERTSPKVIFMDPMTDVWGYKLKDYAQELIGYINNNYVPLDPEDSMLANVWVKPNFKNEALFKLNSRLNKQGSKEILVNYKSRGGQACYLPSLRFSKKIRQELIDTPSDLSSLDLNFATFRPEDCPYKRYGNYL